MKKLSNLLGKNLLSPIRHMMSIVICAPVLITLTACGNVNSDQSKNLDSTTCETEIEHSTTSEANCNLKGQILLLDSEVNSIALNDEELGNIQKIIESGTWNEETADCIDDCLISIDGIDYYYHRECGTINDKIHRRHMILNNEDKKVLNSIIASCSDWFLWLEIFNDNVIAANALDFEEGLKEVVSYLRGIDDSFDLSNYKISMRSFNDNEGIVTLDYYIGNNISTTRGFTFIYCDGMLVSLTYNSQLYSNGRSTYQTVDEDNMIALVNSYEADRSSTMNTSILEEQNTISYYTYDYKTGELKYVSEVYTFDGEAWNGNATEVILNWCTFNNIEWKTII